MAKVTFEIEGVSHSLYFGMLAIELWTTLVAEEAVKLKSSPNTSDSAFNIKGFAMCVYAGLCNNAEMNRQNHPDFEDAYILADGILAERNGLDLKIWNTFINSRAGKPVMDKLAPEKKSEEVENISQSTGTKSEPTPTEL